MKAAFTGLSKRVPRWPAGEGSFVIKKEKAELLRRLRFLFDSCMEIWIDSLD